MGLEKPLVRVPGDTGDVLEATDHFPVACRQYNRATVGSIHVKPYIALISDISKFFQAINAARTGCSTRCHDNKWSLAGH